MSQRVAAIAKSRARSGGDARLGGHSVEANSVAAFSLFDSYGDPAVPPHRSRVAAWAESESAANTEEPVAHSDRRAPLPGFWETVERDLKLLPQDLWADTKRVYTRAPNLAILGLTYGGALALQETGPDDTIEDSLNHKRVFKEDVSDAFGALGNPATHFGVAGLWYLVGQQRQDEEIYDVGRKLFSALIITDLTTVAGKLGAWDKSPNGEYFAFPSGHTSSTFALASVLDEQYGPLVGIPLYALGSLVAVERLDDGEHYFSDVVMGAVVGLVVGHTIGGDDDIEVFGGRIIPYADPYQGATGIAWHYEF